MTSSKYLRIFVAIAFSAFSIPVPSFASTTTATATTTTPTAVQIGTAATFSTSVSPVSSSTSSSIPIPAYASPTTIASSTTNSALPPVQIGPPAPFPTGASGAAITSGSATVSQNGNETKVNVYSSGTTAIYFNSYDIASGYSVNYTQANSKDTVLNVVTGAWGVSYINGSLTANGNIWILNPYGVVFGSNANVNVGGLLAGAGTISANANGSWDFESIPGTAVTNMGDITINHSNSYAAFLGSQVSNIGNITAEQGTIALAAAQGMTINMPISDNINIVLNSATVVPGNSTHYPVLGPPPVSASVNNTGSLQANGGEVMLESYVNNLPPGAYAVNTTGTIMSNSLNGSNGNVQLSARTDGSGQGGINMGGTISGDNIVANAPDNSMSLTNGTIEADPSNGDANINLSALNIDSTNENISAVSQNGIATISLTSNSGDIDFNDGEIYTSGNSGDIEILSVGNINVDSSVLESLGFSGDASIGLIGKSVTATDTAMEAGSYSLPSYNQGAGVGTIDITSLRGDVNIQGGGTYTAIGNTAYLNFNAASDLNVDSIFASAQAGDGANVNFISGGALNYTNSYLWALPGQYSAAVTGDSDINFQSTGDMSLSDDPQLYASSGNNSSINLISDGSFSVDSSTIKSTGSLIGTLNVNAGDGLDNATLNISSTGLMASGANTNLTVLNNSSGNLTIDSDNLSSKGSSGNGNLIVSNWGASTGQGSITFEGSNTLSGDSVITSTNNYFNNTTGATTVNANEYEIDTPNSPIYLSGGSIIVNPISGDANITLIGSSVGLDNENLYATALNGNASIDIEGTTAVSILKSHLTATSVANGSGTINVTSSSGPGHISNSILTALGSSDEGSISLSSGGVFTIDSNSILNASGQNADIELNGSGLDVSDATFTSDGGMSSSGATISFNSPMGEIDLSDVYLNVNASEGLALIDVSAGDEGNSVFDLNIDNDPLGLAYSTFTADGQSAQIQMYATGTLNLGSGGDSDTLTATTTSILPSYAKMTLSGDSGVNVNAANIAANATTAGDVYIDSDDGNISIANSVLRVTGNSTDTDINAINDGNLLIDSSSIVNLSSNGNSTIELNGLEGIDISQSNLSVTSFSASNSSLQGQGQGQITITTTFDNITNSTFSVTGDRANLQINSGISQISGSNFLAAGGDGAIIAITSDDGAMNINDSTFSAVIGNPSNAPAGDSSITLSSYDDMDLNNVQIDASAAVNSFVEITSGGYLTVESGSNITSEGGLYQEIDLSSSDDMNINNSTLSTDMDEQSAGDSDINLDSNGLIDVFGSQINSNGGDDSSIQLTADTTISEEDATISAMSALTWSGDAQVLLSASGNINLYSSSNSASVDNASTGNAKSEVTNTAGDITLGNSTINATAIGADNQAQALINAKAGDQLGEVDLTGSSISANATDDANATASVAGNIVTLSKSTISSTSDIDTSNSNVSAGNWYSLDSSSIISDGGLGGASVNINGVDDVQFSSISDSTLSATAEFGDALVSASDGGVEISNSNFKASAVGGSSSASVSGAISGENVLISADSSQDDSTVESASASYASSSFTLTDTPTTLTNASITASNETGNATASAGANNMSTVTISAQTNTGDANTSTGMTNGDTISMSATTGDGNAEDYFEGTFNGAGSINNITMNVQGTGYLGSQNDDVEGLFVAYGDTVSNLTITANGTDGGVIAGVINSGSCTNCNVSATSINNDTSAYVNSTGNIENSTATATSTDTPWDGAGASLSAGGSIDSTDSSTATVLDSGDASADNASWTGSMSNVSASTSNGTWEQEVTIGGYFPYFVYKQTGCSGSACNPQPNIANASVSIVSPSVSVSPGVSLTNSAASSISQILSTAVAQPVNNVISVEPLSLKNSDSDIDVIS